ncbi:DNA polymerase V [Halothiobacillus diazotrophicus]|uniref:DNA polymerase V n=2 Tax=Halothiobacillus diazotrophicus TaxID=1860122 RepID=A0A191ZI31_9GAMM|nr:DNA polymerase V [Halothiobacillus diazotrophicus]
MTPWYAWMDSLPSFPALWAWVILVIAVVSLPAAFALWSTIKYARRTLATQEQQLQRQAADMVDLRQERESAQHLAQALSVDLAGHQATLAGMERRLNELQQERHAAERRIETLQQQTRDGERQLAELQERLAQERHSSEEKLALLEQAKNQFQQAFQALSADALRANNESFLKLAKENLSQFQTAATQDLAQRQAAIGQITQPIRERLEQFDQKLGLLEQVRTTAYGALQQQINDLLQIHLPQLHRETADLVKALRQPSARGRWGEVQLKRVVELAGMLAHCDFEEQVSESTEAGRLRPDMIVHLPGGRRIVVDAKAPVSAYLQAIEATNEIDRVRYLNDHAQQVRTHINQLSKKDYFEQFDPTPEFVVLFVPGEVFFSAALMQDPTLIEFGAEKRVIPASPTTLIALLKAVSYGWRQEALAQNAQEMAQLGREIYERIGTLAEHWQRLGRSLDQSVMAYNQSVGALEGRVLPSARKFRDLGAVHAKRSDIPDLAPITTETRSLTAAEFHQNGSDDVSK